MKLYKRMSEEESLCVLVLGGFTIFNYNTMYKMAVNYFSHYFVSSQLKSNLWYNKITRTRILSRNILRQYQFLYSMYPNYHNL